MERKIYTTLTDVTFAPGVKRIFRTSLDGLGQRKKSQSVDYQEIIDELGVSGIVKWRRGWDSPMRMVTT